MIEISSLGVEMGQMVLSRKIYLRESEHHFWITLWVVT
jgi:hypothetical protein